MDAPPRDPAAPFAPAPAQISIPRSLLFAFLLPLLAFARALTFPFVGWDDPLYVTRDPLVPHPLSQGFLALLRTPDLGYPQPVVVLSYALDHAIAGFDPIVFHLENLALHLVVVALVFACARALTLRARDAGRAALLFAVHPLVVEPVCWVTGRKDLLATAFTLGAVLLVARGGATCSWRRWLAATALAALAILSKASALTVPLLLAITAWHATPRASSRTIAWRVLPSALVALALGVLGVVGQSHVGAVASRGWGDVAPDIAGALAIHLGHLVWPHAFAIGYLRLPGDPSVLAMIVASLAVLAIGALAWRRGSRAETWGLAFALVAYLPAAGIVPVNRWTADSYVYLPLAGVAIALAAFASRLSDRADRPPQRDRAIGAAWAALAIALAVASWVQTSAWSSPEAVWEADTRRYPGNVYGLMQLARTYQEEGRLEDAADAFARLDVEAPQFDDAFSERAAAFDRVGRHARAIALLAAGVRKGDPVCVRDYWMAALRDPLPPPDEAPATLARAFDLGFEPMKRALDEPAVFERVAAILRAERLDDRAAAASAYAATLRARATRAP